MGKEKVQVKPKLNGKAKKSAKYDCPILTQHRKILKRANQRRDLSIAIIEAVARIAGKPSKHSVLGMRAVKDRTKMIAMTAAKDLLESYEV